MDLALVEISDPNAKLEGGDVLFTGKEFFVGLSEFTNEAGARAVAAAFPEFPVCPIRVIIISQKLLIIFLKSFSLKTLLRHLTQVCVDTFDPSSSPFSLSFCIK